MAFCLSYKRNEGQINFNMVLRERHAPSPIVYSKDRTCAMIGELYDAQPEEVFASGWENNPSVLNDFCSAICVTSFDKEGCSFASDLSGYETLWYYHANERFVLADTFWDVVKVVQPELGDLDKETLNMMFVAGGGLPPNYKTPIKGLKYLPPSSLGRYDAKRDVLEVRKFGYLRRTGSISSMSDAVESLDTALKRMTQSIASSFPDATFGLGLSGGLDSRIALHYLQQQGIKPNCFNISTLKPHHLFLANNIRRSHDLARIAACSYIDIEWDPESISNKMNLLLRMQPLGTAGHYTNAFKYEEEGFPSIDVLLTAGQVLGSHLVGASAPLNSAKMGLSEMVDYLLVKRNCDSVRAFQYDLQMMCRHLGRRSLSESDGPGADIWKEFAPAEARETLRSLIEKEVETKMLDGWHPADIFLEFITNTQSSIARYGAYESRLGTMRSFTLYSPHMFKAGLEWDISLIEDRKILKELIKTRIPEFVSVGEERIGAINDGSLRIATMLNKIEFFLRGDGIMSDEWRANHREILKCYKLDMTNECIWFKLLFPRAEDWGLVKKLSPSRRGVAWSIKRLIDCIETKAYLDF